MGGDQFRFRQFTVRQSRSAMKVGTDGVLLGSWVFLDGHERAILDVGTGTGLIALMVAQRSSDFAMRIDAVEIEQAAACEAADNVIASPWGDLVKVENLDFQSFARRAVLECKRYDVIVSNPPYFNGSYKSQVVERTAARHSELLNSDDLIDGVVAILSPEGGRFSAIFPYENAAVFIAKAAAKGLFCNRMMEIYSKPSSRVKRIMAEFSFVKGTLETTKLVISDLDGAYTDDYRRLTADFYIKF